MLFGEIESVVTTRTGKEKNIEKRPQKITHQPKNYAKNGNCINKKKHSQRGRCPILIYVILFIYLPMSATVKTNSTHTNHTMKSNEQTSTKKCMYVQIPVATVLKVYKIVKSFLKRLPFLYTKQYAIYKACAISPSIWVGV